MPIQCPHCGSRHDVAKLFREESFKCSCGLTLDISMFTTVDDFLRYFESEEEKRKADAVQKDAQLICRMILDENFQDVDIEIAMSNLKEKVKKLFPGKLETYEMIYEARFQRLWAQFRNPKP